MLFAFHINSGVNRGCIVEVREHTATQALRALRASVVMPCAPHFCLQDVDTCRVSEEMEHSPTNEELMEAAHTIVNHFWVKLHHCVDVTVEVLDNN